MKKIVLNLEDFSLWMQTNWCQYASQTVRDKRLRLLVNNYNQYKVLYESKVLYQGSQMTHAIAAWESV